MERNITEGGAACHQCRRADCESGFVDTHSHSDVTIESNPFCESTIRQGITTEIVGNCGDSTALFPPVGNGTAGGFGRFDNGPCPMAAHWESTCEVEHMGISGNLAWLVGHNSLRTLAGVKGPEVTEQQYK